jgi:tRNA isopentenyl-2-thiomethyl-A-37 hydroxylase MiaE
MIHLDDVLRTQLDQLNRFLAIYTTSKGWIEAADYAATILLQGAACSRRLQAWAKEFIHDWSALPYHNHSNSGCGSLLDDIDFVLPLFWAELETPFFANSPPFSTNRREAILSNLEHFPFSFMLHFLMFLDLLLCFMFHF